MTYKQHWVTKYLLQVPDEIEVTKSHIIYRDKKVISLGEKTYTFNLGSITVTLEVPGIMGWIFGYRRLVIDSDGKEHVFKYIPKEFTIPS